jgi:hypothetical protein
LGESSASDLVYNSELVEHKINLMLLLFDFRQGRSMNITEVIIMLQTAIQAMQKIYPESVLFKNTMISDEIRFAMVRLFGTKLEERVLEIFGEVKGSSKQANQSEIIGEMMVMRKPSAFREGTLAGVQTTLLSLPIENSGNE